MIIILLLQFNEFNNVLISTYYCEDSSKRILKKNIYKKKIHSITTFVEGNHLRSIKIKMIGKFGQFLNILSNDKYLVIVTSVETVGKG